MLSWYLLEYRAEKYDTIRHGVVLELVLLKVKIHLSYAHKGGSGTIGWGWVENFRHF